MTDVAIIGAGPVGLVLAHCLGVKGRRVRLLDRAPGPPDDKADPVGDAAAALSIDADAQRLFQSLGLARAVDRLTDSRGHLTRARFEALLRERLEHFRGMSIDWGQEVINLVADGEGVTLTCATTASRTFLRADYVVGCDGAASFTRHWIGGGTRPAGASGASLARRWRRGRVFVAGTAAHHRPGETGIAEGLRDAANLGWKLGRVLCGELPAAALDSYQSEREPQVEARSLRQDRPPLGPGIAAGGEVLRGTAFPPLVLADGTTVEEGRDYRPYLVVAGDIDESTESAFDDANIDVIPGHHPEVRKWLSRHHLAAALIRPDGAILGTVASAAEVADLLPANWRLAAQ